MADLRGRQNNHHQEGIYGQERFVYDARSDHLHLSRRKETL